MQKKEFIRLNTNDNYLSFGNLFRVIKEESDSTSTFLQSDIFSTIFKTYNIADSTVNNYCTGLRTINKQYKNYFKSIINSPEKDEKLLNIVSNLLNLVQGNYTNNTKALSIKEINNNAVFGRICNRLYNISKNDSDVSISLSTKLHKYLTEDNLYNFFCEVLKYTILDKKQPIYINSQLTDIIEKNIYDTNISTKDIQEFVEAQLNSGIWSIRGINELAKKKNPFACFEIASMEFYGIISGKPRYEKAYENYIIAAKYNHPVANWAVGYLYYEGYIGCKSKKDLYLAFKYFNKARKLNCSNAFNSLGLIILNGNLPHISSNKEKALKMFNKAVTLGNIYAYNNIGKIFEQEKKYKEAFECFYTAAQHGESWAANKIGEYYRKGIGTKKSLENAFNYYTLSSQAPQHTLCPWAKYNLAKYFYLNGCLEIGINKDIDKAIKLLEEASPFLLDAQKELIYIYYDLYIKTKKTNKNYLEKTYYYINMCENNINYTNTIRQEIEKITKDIFSRKVKHIEIDE